MRSLWKVPAPGGQPSGGDSDSGAGGDGVGDGGSSDSGGGGADSLQILLLINI